MHILYYYDSKPLSNSNSLETFEDFLFQRVYTETLATFVVTILLKELPFKN